MNCELAKTEMVAFLRDELRERDRRELEDHLAACGPCRRDLEDARRVLSWTTAASDTGVVEIVDALFRDAVDARASDIHLEPERDGTLLARLRVDGVLHEKQRFPAAMREGVVARVKMLADMNVGETRVEQAGRIQYDAGTSYDLRVSSCPFVYGTGMAIRLLEPRNVLVGLEGLGMDEVTRTAVEALLVRPCGLIVVAGPTGTGRTTTLYNMLQLVARSTNKVMTIEDPVECLLPGVNHGSVNRKAGHTYAAALRAYMRHDLDIVMVGEVQDGEVADLCVRAALTGHLVLASMSTPDALSVPQRLGEMGVEPFLLGGALIGVVAQRLARKVCSACRHDAPASERSAVLAWLGLAPEDIVGHSVSEGAGCVQCRQTGSQGRTALFEVLTVDREVSRALASATSPEELGSIAARTGFRTMRRDGLQKVLAGVTSPEEVMRVLP